MYRGFSLNIENESLFDNDIIDKLICKEYIDNLNLYSHIYNNYQNYLIYVDYPTFYYELDSNYKTLYDDINPDTKNIINKKINSFVDDDNKEINLTDVGKEWFPEYRSGCIYIAFS